MALFDEVNRLSAGGVSDFRLQSYDGWQLVAIGSFDLCYYHDVELRFSGVSYINCPTAFFEPHFQEVGLVEGGRRFAIKTDAGQFEIVAESVSIVIEKVFYYDRGAELKPGERIADWVKRANAPQATIADDKVR